MILRGSVRGGQVVRALAVGLVGVATLALAGSASALTVGESFSFLLPDDDSGLGFMDRIESTDCSPPGYH